MSYMLTFINNIVIIYLVKAAFAKSILLCSRRAFMLVYQIPLNCVWMLADAVFLASMIAAEERFSPYFIVFIHSISIRTYISYITST